MPPTTFSKGHSGSEKQLENITKCRVKIHLYLDLTEYECGGFNM